MFLPHRCVATSAALTTENSALYSCARSLRQEKFTELLPNNKVFRFSGVMSQYYVLFFKKKATFS
jgi:hypothetical protein